MPSVGDSLQADASAAVVCPAGSLVFSNRYERGQSAASP